MYFLYVQVVYIYKLCLLVVSTSQKSYVLVICTIFMY